MHSFSGYLLARDDPLRFAFIDEAGISGSPSDVVSVVAAVVIEADLHWRDLDEYLSRVVLAHIPEEHRKDFVFHAKSISGRKGIFRDINQWPPKRRWQVIKDVLRGNVDIGFDVCLGFVRRTKDNDEEYGRKEAARRRHLTAQFLCLKMIQQLMSVKYPKENATIIIEDQPERKRDLEELQKLLQTPVDERALFKDISPLKNVVHSPHFVNKKQSRHLQFADAVAFAFRGYLSGYKYYDELLSAMFDGPPPAFLLQKPDSGLMSFQGRLVSIDEAAETG